MASITGAQLLKKPPDAKKRFLGYHAETAACAMWLAGQEDEVGTYDVMILSILIAERILIL